MGIAINIEQETTVKDSQNSATIVRLVNENFEAEESTGRDNSGSKWAVRHTIVGVNPAELKVCSQPGSLPHDKTHMHAWQSTRQSNTNEHAATVVVYYMWCDVPLT
jgi:hypothetical protein